MQTEPVFLEIDLSNMSSSDLNHHDLNQKIESQLARWGEPLRWSITKIDRQTNIASIEAIVVSHPSC
jgi:hypothetical protein